MPADCDDSFIPETLAFFNQAINKEASLQGLSGINVCCYNPTNGEMVGTPYPEDGLLSDNIELRYRYRIRGEHWGCIRTDLIKKYHFPEMSGHFFTENRLWFSFPRDGYKVRCYNKCLRARYYESQSLTHSRTYKLDYDTCKMYFLNTAWQLTNVGHLIRKYSFKAYLILYWTLAKQLLKVCLAKVLSIVKK